LGKKPISRNLSRSIGYERLSKGKYDVSENNQRETYIDQAHKKHSCQEKAQADPISNFNSLFVKEIVNRYVNEGKDEKRENGG
jgi:hypothetical protein